MEIRFYDVGEIPESEMSYAVIASKYKEQWVYVQQKTKTTWEIPAGRKEPDEPIFATAKRELFEETGALNFSMREICDYSVTRAGITRFGRLFFAEIEELGPLPDLEIAKICLEKEMPAQLTYPDIQPLLLQRVISTQNTKRFYT